MRGSALILGLLLLSAACEPPVSAPSTRLLAGGADSSATSPADTAPGEAPSSEPQPLRFLPGSPPLRTYDTTFAAHQGWTQSFVIFHADGRYFMVLQVPNSAQFVSADGTPLPYGAPFGLRARVDRTSVSFQFEPHGSTFTGSRPVVLWIYLRYVDLGAAAQLPTIWYQAEASDPWVGVPTTVDLAGNWLKIELTHFSNYRVAF